MAFINSFVLILVQLPGVVGAIFVPVIISFVGVGTFGAESDAVFEGTAVLTIGITLDGLEVDSPYFSLNDFSIAYSVSINLSLSFMSRSITSSSDFCCMTFAVFGYMEGGSFSYFLMATMSSSFFFISAFTPLASLGSCPSSMMISS